MSSYLYNSFRVELPTSHHSRCWLFINSEYDKMIEEILRAQGLEDKLIQEIIEIGYMKNVIKDDYVIDSSENRKSIPIVIEGILKVYRQESNGKEVLLYYLERGETCAMSITCCVEKRDVAIKVIAEEDAKIWMIPNFTLDKWVSKYSSFRKFVFASYQNRFDELMNTVDSLVFTNMEDRLMKYLLDTKLATGSFEINKTHQQIASELSTSRVVVSRLLKKLEQEGKIEQHRNRIEIL